MLQQVLEEIRNYFVREPNPGKYTISGGVISPAVSLYDGQRFWIVGSALNDGVYTWHQAGITDDDEENTVTLKDEAFEGCVCALGVPTAVLDMAKEIAVWQDKYGDEVDSPYQSENVIGVYSYEKKSGGGTYSSGVSGWQLQFKSRLNRWRKVSV